MNVEGRGASGGWDHKYRQKRLAITGKAQRGFQTPQDIQYPSPRKSDGVTEDPVT